MTEQPPEPRGNAPLQEEWAARADKPLPAPILVCDEPEEGAVVTRGTVVSGWVLSAAGIREVSVWMDGQRMVGETEYGLLQKDVAQDYPDWPNALRSGFCYRFKEVPFSESTQSAELVVAAEDRRGRRAEVRRVVRRKAERIIKEKKQKLRRTNKTRDERRRRRKRARQEIFLLESELRVLEEGGAHAQVAATGALPDFLIIGAAKSGTASLYHLLIQHPHVEPCAHKEIHFFDLLFDDGVEWYRRCFPTPRWKDGRKTITGEATPGYLFYPYIPERVAKVAPHARLIALLRNPVDRAYSQYQSKVRRGQELLTFEEAIEEDHEYLSRGLYVDQLLRWSKFFSEKQMLVLKSEDFFEHTQQILKLILDFLDLPNWEPEAWELVKVREHEEGIDPATRRRLQEYFEPHNRRLYDYLGTDLGW